MRAHLGCPDEEMAACRAHPRHVGVMSKAAAVDRPIIVEVVTSQGCTSRHAVSDYAKGRPINDMNSLRVMSSL